MCSSACIEELDPFFGDSLRNVTVCNCPVTLGRHIPSARVDLVCAVYLCVQTDNGIKDLINTVHEVFGTIAANM